MNETPSSSEITINERRLRRLQRLTFISLCLNGVILLLILLGFIAHHRRLKDNDGFAGGPENGRSCFHHGFYHHHRGGMSEEDWDRGEMNRGGNEDQSSNDEDRHGEFDGANSQEENGRLKFHHPRFGEGPAMGPSWNNATPDPTEMTDRILDRLTQDLTLSDDQKAKIKPIISEQVTQLQKDMEDRKQALQKQFDDGRAKIRPILNADQQKQLDQMPRPGERADQGATNKPAPSAAEKPNP